MAKWHVNPETNEVNKCGAVFRSCPYKDFSSKEGAEAAREMILEKKRLEELYTQREEWTAQAIRGNKFQVTASDNPFVDGGLIDAGRYLDSLYQAGWGCEYSYIDRPLSYVGHANNRFRYAIMRKPYFFAYKGVIVSRYTITKYDKQTGDVDVRILLDSDKFDAELIALQDKDFFEYERFDESLPYEVATTDDKLNDLRKSLLLAKVDFEQEVNPMEIGWVSPSVKMAHYWGYEPEKTIRSTLSVGPKIYANIAQSLVRPSTLSKFFETDVTGSSGRDAKITLINDENGASVNSWELQYHGKDEIVFATDERIEKGWKLVLHSDGVKAVIPIVSTDDAGSVLRDFTLAKMKTNDALTAQKASDWLKETISGYEAVFSERDKVLTQAKQERVEQEKHASSLVGKLGKLFGSTPRKRG